MYIQECIKSSEMFKNSSNQIKGAYLFTVSTGRFDLLSVCTVLGKLGKGDLNRNNLFLNCTYGILQ